MAVRQEAGGLYVSELNGFGVARVQDFFYRTQIDVERLEALDEAGWVSQIKGEPGYKGSKLILSERKHLYNYGWCRMITFEVKVHPDLPSQRMVEMRSQMVHPVSGTVSTSLVEPFLDVSATFGPVDSVAVVIREDEGKSQAGVAGPLSKFYRHFIVAKNQFATYEQEFTPQKDIV